MDFRRAGSSNKGSHERAQLEQALMQAQEKAQAMQRAFNELHGELDEMRRDGSAQQVERLRAENDELAAGLGLLIKSKEEAQNRLKSIKSEGIDASRRISILERERDSAERTCEDLREELSLAREVIAKTKAGGCDVDPASSGARGGGGGQVSAELMEKLEESEKRAAQLESSAKTAAGAHVRRVEELEGSIASLEASLEGAHERAKADKRALQDALAELEDLKRRVSSQTEREGAMSSGASSPRGISRGCGGDLASSSSSFPDDVASLQRSLRIAIDGRNDAEKRFERAREEALKWSRLVSGRHDHAAEYESEMQRNIMLEQENGKLEARLKQATEKLGQLERDSVSKELVEEERAKNSRLEALLDQVNGDLALEVRGWRNKLEDEIGRRAEVEERLHQAVGEAEKARKEADEVLAREASAPREGVDGAARMSEAGLEERVRMEREIVELRANIEALEGEREQAATKWGALMELMKVRPCSVSVYEISVSCRLCSRVTRYTPCSAHCV